jgi:large subunit ribosomal protein L10e
MAVRKAAAYRFWKRPYTRKSKVRSKGYIKTVPPMNVVKFVMGNSRKFFENKYPFIAKIICDELVQVRDIALESARRQLHREIEVNIGMDYYMAVSVYPHHILRENKMLTGAGADRMQTGMSHSFGTTVGRAAQVKVGQPLFTVALPSEDAVKKFRSYYHITKQKLPCTTHIEVEKIQVKEKEE